MGEIYTKEQLEGLNRLMLRKILKELGADAEEIGSMKVKEMIDTILDAQDSAEEEEQKPPKRGRGRPPKAEPSKSAASSGRGSGKGRGRGRPRKEEPEPEEAPEEEPRASRTRRSRKAPINEESAASSLEDKLNELGSVCNSNFSELSHKIEFVKQLLTALVEELEREKAINVDVPELLEEVKQLADDNA